MLALPAAEARTRLPGKGTGAGGITATGASLSPDFAECVQDSVIGRSDDECTNRGESPPCVGLRRALENSRKQTLCVKKIKDECKSWSHRGLTQEEWVSVAAGHLANFGVCVKKQYGSDESLGFAEAYADENLVAFLRELDDGSKVFRLPGGSVLVNALQENRFGYLIENSPYARERTPHDLYLIKDAAETPAMFNKEVVANAEGFGPNPAQEGENFRELIQRYGVAEVAPEPGRVPAAQTKRGSPAPPAPATDKPRPWPLPKPSAPASAAASARENPYSLGLDRTLFERVNSAYRKRAESLRGLEDYVKTYSPAPPKDMSDLLSRGGTL